jgi:regulator of replication initiation timing
MNLSGIEIADRVVAIDWFDSQIILAEHQIVDLQQRMADLQQRMALLRIEKRRYQRELDECTANEPTKEQP